MIRHYTYTVNHKQVPESKYYIQALSCTYTLDLLYLNGCLELSVRKATGIFEIEGVERSLYGYLMFTHCGVIYTLW